MPWPNFFIVGSHKSGTTTLYEYLKNTNGVYMTDEKAPNFFSVTLIPENFVFPPIRDEKKYLSLFDAVADEVAIGEASAMYLQDPKAAELIHEHVPDAKIIIMLRDPVERAFSHYLMFKGRFIEKRTFRESIDDYLNNKIEFGMDYLGGGLYLEQIQRYWNTFGKNNVKILIFEEFINNTFNQVTDILQFLNLSSKPPTSLKNAYNRYSTPKGKILQYFLKKPIVYKVSRKLLSPSTRMYLQENILTKPIEKPKLLDDDRKFLVEFYIKSVKELSSILNKSLQWKNFA